MAYDIRTLNELAFQAQLLVYGPSVAGGIVTTSDLTKQDHPAIKIMSTDPGEEIAPGSGIYKCRVEILLVVKADAQGVSATSYLIQAIRQAFYRNDITSRPMQNLAAMLTTNQVAAGNPFTCLGVVPLSEGPVSKDEDDRMYTFRWAFDVHSMPRNP